MKLARSAHPSPVRARRPAFFVAALALGAGACGDDTETRLGPEARVGTVTVRFGIVDGAGEPVTCQDARVASFRVAVGGVDQMVACGADQVVRFELLLYGRYPVRIETLLAGDAVAQSHVGNVVVDAPEVEYSHSFPAQGAAFGAGTLEVIWFIDGEDVALACPTLMGDRVRIRLDGPQNPITVERPCLDGQTRIEGLRQGSYRVELDLLDASGRAVGTRPVEPSVQIRQNETERVILEVTTTTPGRGALRGEWTVNSSVAAAGCAAAAPDTTVRIDVSDDQTGAIAIATATAACTAGVVTLPGLPTGRSEGRGLRATFRLFDTVVGTRLLATALARDIVLVSSRTSTVTVDLQVSAP